MYNLNFTEAIADEINRQKELHGDRERELQLWLVIIGEEIGELVEAIETGIHHDIYTEAIQVAAYAVAATGERINPENCGVFSFSAQSQNYDLEIKQLIKAYGFGCRSALEKNSNKFYQAMTEIVDIAKTIVYRNFRETSNSIEARKESENFQHIMVQRLRKFKENRQDE